MSSIAARGLGLAVLIVFLFTLGLAQDAPFEVGQPLDTSDNVRIFGSFVFAEACAYDAERDLFVVPSAGVLNNDAGELINDGYVSLINPDGSVHTTKWIGMNRDGLTLHHPFGTDIVNGMLYLADRDTVRWFDMATGEPAGSVTVEGASWMNDLEVADDGTIYASHTGSRDDASTWRIYRITPDGDASVFAEGEPLARPNGVAFDNDGNIVVVNIASPDILTFSPEGELLSTIASLDSVNDGLVILDDGTMIVSSVGNGTIARIPPGGEPALVASGIPSAASICYDPTRNHLLVPMNNNNAVALVDLN